MSKKIGQVLWLFLLVLAFTGCVDKGMEYKEGAFSDSSSGEENGSLQGVVTMSGSTSMEDLVNAFGAAFKKEHPEVNVEVQSGGSSVGISNAKEGITDIGNSSRALKSEEKALGLKEYIVALDGIVIVVNPQNTLAGLTTEQLVKIFTGQIKNWKDLGGEDKTIVTIGREAGSGTRDGFEDILKIKDKASYTIEANETGLVKSKVKEEKYAIGYISLGKVENTVKVLKIDGVTPTSDTITNKTYPIQRPFLCLTRGEETRLVKTFLDFIRSPEGQQVVEKKGYVAVTK